MKGDTLSHWNKKHEDSRDSTTILVSGLGSYRFTRVPMGGKTSGAALQSLEGELDGNVCRTRKSTTEERQFKSGSD